MIGQSEFILAQDGKTSGLAFTGALLATEKAAVAYYEGTLHETDEYQPGPGEQCVVRRTYQKADGTYVGQVEWQPASDLTKFPYEPAYSSVVLESADRLEIRKFLQNSKRTLRAFHTATAQPA